MAVAAMPWLITIAFVINNCVTQRGWWRWVCGCHSVKRGCEKNPTLNSSKWFMPSVLPELEIGVPMNIASNRPISVQNAHSNNTEISRTMPRHLEQYREIANDLLFARIRCNWVVAILLRTRIYLIIRFIVNLRRSLHVDAYIDPIIDPKIAQFYYCIIK